jgi:hypothetical protein
LLAHVAGAGKKRKNRERSGLDGGFEGGTRTLLILEIDLNLGIGPHNKHW